MESSRTSLASRTHFEVFALGLEGQVFGFGLEVSCQGCGSSQKFQCFRFQLFFKYMLPSSLPLPHLWNFLLPLPAPDRISRFLVRFRFQSLSSKCFRFCFHKNFTTSSFPFHIPVCNSCDWLSTRFHKLQVTLLGLLGSATC